MIKVLILALLSIAFLFALPFIIWLVIVAVILGMNGALG